LQPLHSRASPAANKLEKLEKNKVQEMRQKPSETTIATQKVHLPDLFFIGGAALAGVADDSCLHESQTKACVDPDVGALEMPF
jgi:hypothetical protein